MRLEVPTFPPYVIFGVFLAFLPITLMAARRLKDPWARYLLVAIWGRYLMSALHQYTFSPIIGGLSLNALASVAFAVVGIAIIDKRFLSLKALGSVYLVIFALVASALANGYLGAVGTFAKWSYLIALTTVALGAFRRNGATAVLSAVLTVFLPPLALQALSVMSGLSKGSEDDGSICFIGGYNHEGGFSIIVLTFLCCGCFLVSERPKLTIGTMAIAVVSLLLANYRTSILASLPILAGTAFFGTVRRFSPSDRPIIVVVIGLSGAALLYATSVALEHRFSDLSTILSTSVELIKPPEYYTTADGDLLSGRLLIWSRYMTAYLNGTLLNLALGFGPDSWEKVFPHYAHNTFVSALYEAGLFGLVSMVALFTMIFINSLRVEARQRPVILCANLGFFLLNLATMPLWMIEGNVLLALILAYTLYLQSPGPAGRHSLKSARDLRQASGSVPARKIGSV